MDKSGIWVLIIFQHHREAVILQRYDRAMLEQRIEQQFIDSADLKYQAAQVLSKPMAAAVQSILVSVTGGGKVLACGNGGSGALAQLFAATFVGHHERERPDPARERRGDEQRGGDPGQEGQHVVGHEPGVRVGE